ncbi:hypothetical protein C4H03_RS15710 [Vibrio parahaemolyticus]|nr:hypothetical protein [Vibrio parahaemolyticus]EJB0384922.1 hypothetical protein [Vibrio parahaemolyticus]EJG1104545.1 hypothetical protein [Vibrio parahaemolyticus]ELA6667083.1 hypothetical protein [Vibrio parahaemolyticus]
MSSKYVPIVKTILFYICISFGVCARFLLGNLYGVLITMFVIRHFSEALLGYPAYSFEELMAWLDALSNEMKIAIVSSLVTVIGFLVAYASATSNWKSQLLANIKLQASGELNSFFTEVGALVTDCEIYADETIETSEKIRKSKDNHEKLFLVSYQNGRGHEIDLKRKRLVAMSIQVHQFTGKYANLFLSVPRVQSNFDTAAKALNEVASKTWFNIPVSYPEDTDPITTFLKQVNEEQLKVFKASVEKNRIFLSFYPGSAGGILQSGVVPFNGFSLFNMYRRIKELHSAFEELRKAKQDS